MAPQASERFVLIPAVYKNSTTGYKNVNYDRGNNKFKAQVRVAGKSVSLGYDTAEEAAIAYARSEYGRADAGPVCVPGALGQPYGRAYERADGRAYE